MSPIWAWAGAAKRSEATRASAVPVVAIFQRTTRDTDTTARPSLGVRDRLTGGSDDRHLAHRLSIRGPAAHFGSLTTAEPALRIPLFTGPALAGTDHPPL